MKRILSISIGAAALLLPAVALAQAPANSGTVTVAAQGFDKADKPAEGTDATEAALGAGGLISSGNVNSASLNATARGRLRRGDNQAKADIAGNYAATTETKENTEVKSVAAKNLQGTLRYDHFFSSAVAGFVRASGLYDEVKLIDFRLNVAVGAAFYIISKEKEELFLDLGYAPEKTWLRSAEVDLRHNVRVGGGYSAALSENVAVSILGEYLLALNQITSAAPGCATDAPCSVDNKRLNAQLFLGGRIDSKIYGKFSLATSAGLRWDGNPPLRTPSDLATSEQLSFYDFTAAVNLVYNLF
jgi:hypothetical protein